MTKIYSYILRFDDGAAPNPFWRKCTLTICKPIIRRTADKGDWVIGTGSKNTKLKDGTKDFSKHLVYAMKVSDKMSLEEYDIYCRNELLNKIPKWNSKNWKFRMGDCIYDYSKGNPPILRESVHKDFNIQKDLRGNNALISDHFYYFGENPIKIPECLHKIIKISQGHLKITNNELIQMFEKWIEGHEANKVYANPQLSYLYENMLDDEIKNTCSKRCKYDFEDSEEVIN